MTTVGRLLSTCWRRRIFMWSHIIQCTAWRIRYSDCIKPIQSEQWELSHPGTIPDLSQCLDQGHWLKNQPSVHVLCVFWVCKKTCKLCIERPCTGRIWSKNPLAVATVLSTVPLCRSHRCLWVVKQSDVFCVIIWIWGIQPQMLDTVIETC